MLKVRTILRAEVEMSRPEAEGQESADAIGSVPAASAAPAAAVAPAPRAAKCPILAARAAEWRAWMVEGGEPAYRARQVLDWVIRRRAASFEPMSDLPRSLRQRLDAD